MLELGRHGVAFRLADPAVCPGRAAKLTFAVFVGSYEGHRYADLNRGE